MRLPGGTGGSPGTKQRQISQPIIPDDCEESALGSATRIPHNRLERRNTTADGFCYKRLISDSETIRCGSHLGKHTADAQRPLLGKGASAHVRRTCVGRHYFREEEAANADQL